MGNLYYFKFSFDCIILGFCQNVVLVTLGKSASPPFLLSERRMKQSVLLMAAEKKRTQRKQLENIKQKIMIKCCNYASELKFLAQDLHSFNNASQTLIRVYLGGLYVLEEKRDSSGRSFPPIQNGTIF